METATGIVTATGMAAATTAPRNGGNDRGPRNDRGGFNRNNDNRQRPGQNAPARPAANNRPAQPAAPAAPAEPVEKERTVRHVDTKTSDVNLDKYNEHYEDIAPEKAVRRGDSQQKKQKLKQKSQQQKKGKFGGQKKETEAEKLQRLALERARKQQLKVMIPDEITVSELASRTESDRHRGHQKADDDGCHGRSA